MCHSTSGVESRADGSGTVVIIGGSIGGTVAAAAVAPLFERVIIIERDDIEIDVESLSRPQSELSNMALDAQRHRSVGQMMMVHTLTPAGLHAFEHLLPGFTQDAQLHGAEQLDKNAILEDKIAIYMGPKRCARWTSETYTVLPASRPLVERAARLRLLKDFKNVDYRKHTAVANNTFSPDGKFVTGVELKNGDRIPAALVIDTTGRKGLSAMTWLKEKGYGIVRSVNVDPGLSYIIQHFKLSDEAMAQENRRRGLFIFPTHPHSSGITLQAIEGDIYTAGLILLNKEKRVSTLGDFMERVKALPSMEPYEMLKDATPIGEIYAMHGAKGTTRRYFEEVTIPDGFIVMGDAICSLNPRFGQGMTVAAMQGEALRRELELQINRKGADVNKAVPLSAMEGFTNPFQKTAAAVLEWPYAVATGGDLEFPFTTGPRTRSPLRKMIRGYIMAARDLGYKDTDVAQALGETTLLMQPPVILFAPSMMRKVIPHAIKLQLSEGSMTARIFIIMLLGGLLAMAFSACSSILSPLITKLA